MHNSDQKYPFEGISWPARSKMMASWIPASSTVIDLGGGDEELLSFLKVPVRYFPVDKFKRTERTILADLDKDLPQIPDLDRFAWPKYIVAAGLFEYITDPGDLMKKIRIYGDRLITSYKYLVGKPKMARPTHLSAIEFEEKLEAAGWAIEEKIDYSEFQRLYLCRKI